MLRNKDLCSKIRYIESRKGRHSVKCINHNHLHFQHKAHAHNPALLETLSHNWWVLQKDLNRLRHLGISKAYFKGSILSSQEENSNCLHTGRFPFVHNELDSNRFQSQTRSSFPWTFAPFCHLGVFRWGIFLIFVPLDPKPSISHVIHRMKTKFCFTGLSISSRLCLCISFGRKISP